MLAVTRILLVIFVLKEGRAQALEEAVQFYGGLAASATTEANQFEYPTDARQYEAANKSITDIDPYDFVIIGAGSTGSVIANRLSEVNHWKVLVLEAGTYGNNLTSVPGFFGLGIFSEYNWGYLSVPQTTACLGNVDQRCVVHRGRGVGGTSLINGLYYARGNPLDYQKLSETLDDPSWNYTNVLPYFKKSENFNWNDPQAPVDLEYHGEGGYLDVDFLLPESPFVPVFLNASEKLGYQITDYNGKQQLGASILQICTKNGRRFDQGTAFILPVLARQNLTVSIGSYVTKINFNKNKAAKSVIFTKNNQTYRVRARKEVILSAGVIASPQILMLSGIGPAEHLSALGIPVVQDLAVGGSLRDHQFSQLVFSNNLTQSPETFEQVIADYLNGTGSLAASDTILNVGWFQTDVEPVEDYPDLEVGTSPYSGSDLGKKFYRWTDETYNALFNISSSGTIVEMTLSYLHSKSNGTLRLNSSDAFEYPLIDLDFLSDENETDIEALYQGIQKLLELTNTEAFRAINMTLETRQWSACSATEFLSKEFWYCFLRQTTQSEFHPVGTCPAGIDPNQGAVVNKNLKVFGVKKLRVADASIFPFPLTNHPNAACTMVGEKISDIIKKKHGIEINN